MNGVEKADSQKNRVAIYRQLPFLSFSASGHGKEDWVTLTRTKKAARPSIILEFLVRYAILSLSLSCRYVVKVR